MRPRLHIQDARHDYAVMMPDYLVRYGADDAEELQRPLKWPRVRDGERGRPGGGVSPPGPGGGVSSLGGSAAGEASSSSSGCAALIAPGRCLSLS